MKKALLLLLVASLPLIAQNNTATISGTVTDASGAAVANAPVSAFNVSTNLKRDTVTNAEGQYVFEFLPTGGYRVEVSATGFKKFVRSGLILEINQSARVDAVVNIGAVSEVLTVNGATPIVNTENATLGRVTDGKEITELPIVDRNVYALLTLTPGVENSASSIVLGYPEQRTNINGGADGGAGSVNYYLDGGTNMNGLRNTGAIVPNPDAVQEFKIITNSYGAEYGHFAGGVIIAITRSGGNQLHGTLYEFLRNDKMAAYNWGFATKSPLHRNEFGATLGGPIKKDKLFFFGSYGGLRWIQPQSLSGGLMPTTLERGGDFSASATKPNDPLTGKPFPNNLIPTTRMDPTSLNILNYYSKTGLGIPAANGPAGTFQGSVPSPQQGDEFLLKGDYYLNSKHTVTASYYQTNGNNMVQPGSQTPWATQLFNWRQHNSNLGDTWAINSNTINELHADYQRNFGGRLNLPATSLGDLGSKYTIQGTPSLPQISITGFFALTNAIGGPTAGSNYYEVRDTLSMTRGRHTLKVGGSMNLQKYVQDTLLNNYGTFTFSSTSLATTNAWANYLLGIPTTMNQDTPVTAIDNGWYYGFFAQDDFRVSSRLTINMGLRWDWQLPLTDVKDRKDTFQLGAQSTVVPTALPGLLFPGDPGIPRGIVPVDKHQIGPRLGLAWDPFGNGKTSIRAAAGIFYGSISGNEWNTPSNNQPFAIRQQFPNVQSLTNPYGSLVGGDPYPYYYTPSAPRFIKPTAPYGILQNFVWPYTYQLNFSIQREVMKDLSVTASYVGSLAHRLPFAADINYPVFNSTATSSNFNNRRPILPGTYGAIMMVSSDMQSEYNALQLTVEKRLSHNFMLKGFYTYSKDLSDVQLDNNTLAGGATDFSNLALDRGRTDFDRRHVANVSFIWKSDYFGSRGAFLRNTLNGWTVSSIVTLRSGSPLNITTGKDNNFDGTANDRPLVIANPFLDPGRSRSDAANMWFNTAAFTNQANGLDGTTPRNYLDNPGTRNVDMAFFRDFKIRERFTFQFRGEMTNAFNLVNLSGPTATLSSTIFGKITTAGAMRVGQLGARFTF